ncbi:MAG: trypsin-like peptidase domain-containing protein [Lachnospiraceae bacterium]|nr:trypsin-like peptidase domain-containing protein [Lachnospiraceae bacterium]
MEDGDDASKARADEAKEEEKPLGDEIVSTSEWSGSNLVQTTVTDVTEVVKAVMPSVVSVNNKYIETTSFWGRDFSSEGTSTGSGIIVGKNDTELLLVTNYHVVEAAEELSVQFADGSQVQAQMKGSDSDKDLAVIAVQLTDIDSSTMNAIAVAKMGDSTQLTVGEPVIAIGNALGYGQSVTTGVVSALNRPIAVSSTSSQTGVMDDTEVNTFIQTDAAINPGNSGGALLNSRGEVIGINSNKIGGSAVEGMGYAIPISDAQPIIEKLMTRETRLRVEEADRGFLGITGIDVVAEYSQLYGMPKGVYISSVSEGTGAAEAGLVRGDIITALNGEEVKSMDDLKEELSYYSVGSTVELTIMQGSPTGFQAKTVSVTLGAAANAQ